MTIEFDLNACVEGDQGAWDDFINQTAGLIHAAVRRTAGRQLESPSGPDLDDCVQAVYMRLLKNDCRLMRNYDPNRASLSTWVTLVARSVTIDLLRRKSLPMMPLQDFDRAIDQQSEPDDPSGSLDQAAPMHLLTERQELVLRLLFEDSRTVSEVATSLGIDEQTVRSTKHKGLERRRNHFKQQKNGGEISK